MDVPSGNQAPSKISRQPTLAEAVKAKRLVNRRGSVAVRWIMIRRIEVVYAK